MRLNELAKHYLVYEESDGGGFQRKARILQSIWRSESGYEAGEYAGKIRGNYLEKRWAEKTLNNYLSETIKGVVAKEVNENAEKKLYARPRIFNNLLSSQPLAFNLFAELKADLRLASDVFRYLLPERVDEVVRIEFEHSPGRGSDRYTGDRSAFDVYAEFLNKAGEKGFVGIEVKYHENLRNQPARMKQRYREIAFGMDCFDSGTIEKLEAAPMEQI